MKSNKKKKKKRQDLCFYPLDTGLQERGVVKHIQMLLSLDTHGQKSMYGTSREVTEHVVYSQWVGVGGAVHT